MVWWISRFSGGGGVSGKEVGPWGEGSNVLFPSDCPCRTRMIRRGFAIVRSALFAMSRKKKDLKTSAGGSNKRGYICGLRG